jgi:phage gp29-like protein
MQHDKGDFCDSAKMASMSLFDPRVFGAIQTRVFGALSLPLVVFGKKPEWFDRVVTRQVLASIDLWSIFMGFALIKVHVDTSNGKWVPSRLEVVNPQFIHTYNNGFLVTMVDGSSEYVDETSEGWIIHKPFASEHPWLMGAIRSVATNFADKYFTNAFWARRTEVESVGIRVATVPDDADKADIDAFRNNVQNLGYESTLTTPNGFGFEIKGVDQNASTSFEARMRFLVDGLVVAILGQLGTSDQDSSYATASVLKYAQQDRVTFDLLGLADTIKVLCDRVASWNGKNNKFIMTWDVSFAEDTQKKAAVYQTVSQSIDALVRHGASRKDIFDKFNIGYEGDPDLIEIESIEPIDEVDEPSPDTEPTTKNDMVNDE